MAARITVLLGACLVVPTMIGEAQQGGAAPPPVPLVDGTKTLIMQPEQALAGARVMGDPAKPGWYVSRTRFAAGSGTRPHYHDQDRYVTVIAGTWWTGAGDVYKPETMVPIKAGGFMFHPAGYRHYDQARDEDVVVQIMGMGPVKTVRTEVNEKGEPLQTSLAHQFPCSSWVRSAYSFREFAAVGVLPDLASARCCVQPGGTMRLKTVVDIRLMVAVLGMALLILTWFGLVQWFAGDLPD